VAQVAQVAQVAVYARRARRAKRGVARVAQVAFFLPKFHYLTEWHVWHVFPPPLRGGEYTCPEACHGRSTPYPLKDRRATSQEPKPMNNPNVPDRSKRPPPPPPPPKPGPQEQGAKAPSNRCCGTCDWWLLTDQFNGHAFGQCKFNPVPVGKCGGDWCSHHQTRIADTEPGGYEQSR